MTEFEEIYSNYFKDVYRYSLVLSKNKSIAEDITQETFFKALKKIDAFKGDCKISVWLCQIAKNTYFSYLKKQPYLLEDIDNVVNIPGDDFEQKIIADGNVYEIHKLIHGLEEPYKEVFMLRFFGALSFRKIAELFGKTESWARVTYHRARAKLKEALL
ncbi:MULTISPECIES: RNA polymerase sigma factor [Caproicibacterium]|uniref:Sigma-70 family RNA polymerase sigma factor n=1 Tax=Caproicibacterium lactatifermentans TaxID=2666138 RepID=A0A859DQ42_9FIRM|nr:RNA polymerase sigma factor [Caproicibacterium lactatifermentans]ARP50577.1 RNA polymerase subunit sigma [Ruminococcaceae bacterium CPB6]QKN23704.1 sigma-70 family RNA polymerase sigma factor [Caproicibacterium lactatifermentans]